MEPYDGYSVFRNKRRTLPDELRDWVRKKYNAELVNGFSEILKNKSREYSGRVASFLDICDFRAWYLELSSGGFISFKTEKVLVKTDIRDVIFVFAMGLGNGSVLPQPSGQFDLYLNNEHVVSFRVVKHSQTWRGYKGCKFHFSANRIEAAQPNSSICLDTCITEESFASFGIGLLKVPLSLVSFRQSSILKVVAVSEIQSTRWFQLVNVPHCIDRSNILGGVVNLCENNPARISKFNVYFGDIHTHSGVSHQQPGGCGMGTREDNYLYAYGPGGLDIYALTDHEWQITEEGISDYLNLSDRFNKEGCFITLPGYEHTNTIYGHRNVYFAGSGGKVIPSRRRWDRDDKMDPMIYITPAELWAELKKCEVKSITVPHHPSVTCHPLSWDFHNPEFDRLVEIYSCWGSSEYYGDYPRGVADRFHNLYVREALKRGYRLGIIASSDGHDGHPGNAQSPLIKYHHIFHPLGSGWIAVLANNLTRQEVFDAMYNRRCYGTTGVPILLDFRLNGEDMGSEIQGLGKGEIPLLNIVCHGSNGIDHIRIVKNGLVVETIPCHGEWEFDIEWKDVTFNAAQPNYYYVRVIQIDYESAWSSPIYTL